ncbi:hypothetical protein GGE59_006722 [Rhizobium leguminosarum]|nr:hypothetical protein [Rhizobium leguminosarum]MBB5654992.1 hypothetical protein [Rhizobium leguminosarum]MBB5683770.1 hypothetical protein [Rhizobium leguminosarum]MBP2484642.1 hypothetical protein [Rhizobium leguminosarum]
MMGLPRCMTFGGSKVDAAVARELLRAVEPLAIEATFKAERMHRERQEDQRHIHDLELQQARYEASLAERRYAACDPDNRLIAAQLEKNWETALRRVRDLEVRRPTESPSTIEVDPGHFRKPRRQSAGGLGVAGCHHARAPATATYIDRRHCCRCR